MLLEDGVPLERCLEELCLSDPERVRKVHDAYVAVGAEVIETNTFGANRVRLDRFGFGEKTQAINASAARLALKAAHGKPFPFVASAHAYYPDDTQTRD
jgi:homocysteine S-methyltransferase